MKFNYKKLVKNKRIEVNYEEFKILYKELQKEYQLNNFEIVYISESYDLILKIKKNYYTANTKSLFFLFNEDDLIYEKIKKHKEGWMKND